MVFGAAGGGGANLLVMVTRDLAKRFPARKIIERIAPLVNGRGGGRDDMAQAGGKFPEKLSEALAAVEGIIKLLVSQ